jgi:tetratricopeptide (TPR) repeat protein
MSDILESSSSSSLTMTDLAELLKEIECDSCQKVNPSKRCSRCRGAYYCSNECQKADWNKHKLVCQSRDEQITDHNNHLQRSLPPEPILQEQEQEQIHGTCSICLQEPMVNPIVFPDCHHAFCFNCLAAWQKSSNQCPNCRETTQTSVVQSALQNAMMYSVEERRLFKEKCWRDHHQQSYSSDASDERSTSSDSPDEKSNAGDSFDGKSTSSDSADKKSTSNDSSVNINNATISDRNFNTMDDRQTMYLNLALDQVNRVLLSNPNDVHALRIKGQILLDVEPLQALELFEKVDALTEENAAKQYPTSNATNAPNMILSIMDRIQCSEAMQSMEKYSQALDIYEELEQQVSKLNHQKLQEFLLCSIFMGESRCLIYMKEFQLAEHVAECAVRLNRRYPGVHLLLALAQWALGEKKDAVHTMRRAILYEAPWNTDNQLENREYLQRLRDSMNDEVY